MKSIPLTSTRPADFGFIAIESIAGDGVSAHRSATNPSFPKVRELAGKIDELRIELVELAFSLDQRGNPTAADVATLLALRLTELKIQFNLEGENLGRDASIFSDVSENRDPIR